jgi:hypothetical protein
VVLSLLRAVMDEGGPCSGTALDVGVVVLRPLGLLAY